MQKVLEVAAHYFRICLNGHWPSHDFVGAPYSDGTARGQMSGRPLFKYKGEFFRSFDRDLRRPRRVCEIFWAAPLQGSLPMSSMLLPAQ